MIKKFASAKPEAENYLALRFARSSQAPGFAGFGFGSSEWPKAESSAEFGAWLVSKRPKKAGPGAEENTQA